MNTDLLTIERDEIQLKKHRIWYVPTLLLFLFSFLTHEPLSFLAGLFTLIIGIVPELWHRQSLRHLVVRQQVSQRNVFYGETVKLTINIENRKLLPLPWLQVENKITPSLTQEDQDATRLQKISRQTFSSTWLLAPFQRVKRHYNLRCMVRGLHVFGPLRLWSSDPFGWLDNSLSIPLTETLMVYPLIAPLESLGLSSLHPFGEYSSKLQLLEDPLRFAGIRDYMLGDDPRRIHWKATARTGQIRSKIYEPSSLRRLLILLDTWNFDEHLQGADPDIQELSITTAASLALWGLEESYMVGLLSNSAIMLPSEELLEGKEAGTQVERNSEGIEIFVKSMISAPGVTIPFSLDPEHHERILTTLACLEPHYHTPIERFIETEDEMFPMGTTVVLVGSTSTLSERTIDLLLEQRLRGAAIYLALAGNEADLKTDTLDLPVFYLGGREKWNELITNVNDQGRETVGTSSAVLQLG